MPITPFAATGPAGRKFLTGADWSLCVGAGLCRDIVPDWSTVARQMVSRSQASSIDDHDLQELTKKLGWSLDSFLQYALNNYELSGKDIDQFNNDLAEELYGGLLNAAASVGLRDELAALLSNPFARSSQHLLDLETFLSGTYGTTSLLQIARVLLKAKAADCPPKAVLTFNADVLLHAALTLLQIRESHAASGNLHPDFLYRGIYRSTDQPNGKIPIYHVHGSITPVPGGREARDKLIFPESSYLQLASSVYSWPQTVFLSNAQATRIVFVGLSMSDPNIRRWLGWRDGYRRAELAQFQATTTFSSQHLWITTSSPNPKIQRVKEYGLVHLGVRTAFIPSWDVLGDALANLLGV